MSETPGMEEESGLNRTCLQWKPGKTKYFTWSRINKRRRHTMKRTIAIAVSMSLVGCATTSAEVASIYVSPLQYQGYDCAQIAGESRRIQARITEVGGRLDQAAHN